MRCIKYYLKYDFDMKFINFLGIFVYLILYIRSYDLGFHLVALSFYYIFSYKFIKYIEMRSLNFKISLRFVLPLYLYNDTIK